MNLANRLYNLVNRESHVGDIRVKQKVCHDRRLKKMFITADYS